jgi:hypothetical protein
MMADEFRNDNPTIDERVVSRQKKRGTDNVTANC